MLVNFHFENRFAYYFSFLNSVMRIHEPGYRPTEQDILFSRVATTGVVEVKFKIKELDFRYFSLTRWTNLRFSLLFTSFPLWDSLFYSPPFLSLGHYPSHFQKRNIDVQYFWNEFNCGNENLSFRYVICILVNFHIGKNYFSFLNSEPISALIM